MPRPPARDRKIPPRRPIPGELIEFDIDDRIPVPVPLDVEDIPPGNVEKIDETRDVPIVEVGRGRNDNEEPPPIRPGMNPSVIPP